MLEAKAAAEGLSLKRWIEKLAETAAGGAESDKLAEEGNTPEQSHATSIVDSMRQLRAQTKPDPDGWTVRDYINYGRRQ